MEQAKSNVGAIVLAIVITAVVVGGGVYYWQTQNPTEETFILPYNGTPGPSDPNTETERTFEGSGFSFTYPAKYTADSKGLWTEEGYKIHINPPAVCDTCQIPEVEVKATTLNNTVDQQIISDYYGLPGTTLAEMSKQTGIKYENVKIGDNDFIKITVSDMFNVTGYYTKHNNQIVAFRVYWTEKDNAALREIISTLKF